ncbi:unnamed protein product, partial [Mesorhabditis belari]|uniref:Hepatocyte growth factor-regulated tyrosine kinase substrate n=1 Tax=Mesorhabditis belari TaxID=2138241 RepID=A0AAF3EP91_9BILA
MSKRFEKSLSLATDSNVLETDWDAVLDCVDQIRGGEAKAPEAMVLVLSRLKSENPHVVLHALILLEAMVKNCGKKVHNELATREFMEGIKELAIEAKAETVKTKVLELLQCWAMAFANKAEYKIIVDTHNLMKLAGFDFPSVKEAAAMFASQVAPEWEEGANCYRCRSEFTFLTRKHHCRACGQIFCHGCSSKEMLLPQFGIEKPVRVCDACYEKGVGVALSKQSATPARPKFSSSADESSVVDQFGAFYGDDDSITTLNALAQNNPNRLYAIGNPRAVANRQKQAEKPEGLFKSLFKGVLGNKKRPESSYNPAATDPGAEERERQARLAREKEEEDYQLSLAMAISQSEAEAKEKERANSLYSFYNGVKDQVSSHVSSPMNDTMSIAPSEHIGVYKGAADSVRESPSENSLNADDPLARYLNRDYWQQRKEKANAKVESWDVNPSAPLPSEPSLGGSSYVPTVRGSPPPNNQKELVYSTGLSSLDEETLQKSEDTKKFCADVNEQVFLYHNIYY